MYWFCLLVYTTKCICLVCLCLIETFFKMCRVLTVYQYQTKLYHIWNFCQCLSKNTWKQQLFASKIFIDFIKARLEIQKTFFYFLLLTVEVVTKRSTALKVDGLFKNETPDSQNTNKKGPKESSSFLFSSAGNVSTAPLL